MTRWLPALTVAAALMYAVGEAGFPARAPAFFGAITAYYTWSSRSVLYASALTMPLVAVLVQVLRHSPESARIQSGRHGVGPAPDYWDPARLAANDLTIYEPTPDRLRWRWDRRVRWILIDRAQGRESPRLADLATCAWSAGDVVLYRLRPPGQRAVQVSVAGAVLVPE
ncbi:hypothetical protein [Dactylosporangium sp. NPDC048998]|uniref:hypothetical protein n=1 Tax=Dactylosporangium sp. NPDC048998 TaxID=3363976 RepID=UPI003719DC9A